ncbi:MAG TPA: hypothetical protein VEH84_05390 [Alphaproteobacteria bacterium]|nr:hypothetical protein [Alphaproteobacteria bacterium]
MPDRKIVPLVPLAGGRGRPADPARAETERRLLASFAAIGCPQVRAQLVQFVEALAEDALAARG